MADYRLDGKNPLAYMGVRPQTPPKMIVNEKRAPTTKDYQGYALGTQWLFVDPTDPSESLQYVLVSVAENVATWLPLNEADTFTAPDHSVLLGTGTTAIGSVGPDAATGWPLISQGTSSDPIFGQASVGGGGTGQFVLDLNSVLIGNNTDPVKFAGPSATVGAPLVSTGSGTAPNFGVASVSGGGTGLDEVDPYSVLCGGATSEGPLQTVIGTGNAGQVLKSNGLGALPTWQDESGGGGGSGAPIAVQVFTTSDTYTPTVGMTSCIVELIGGGAGGQSVDTTSSNPIGGNGGGAGSYCRKLFDAAAIGVSQPVVIGTGGATDIDGVDSTFGTGPLLTAGKGLASAGSIPGGGGTATGGDINVRGGNGGISSEDTAGVLFGGFGGSSFYGSGGVALGDTDADGFPGLSYGAGGSGGVSQSAVNMQVGGAGSPGICVITEFGNLPGTGVQTLTGNTGGAVGPDGGSNINVVGAGGVIVTGDAGSNTLTITNATPVQINTIYLTTPGAGTYTPTAGMYQCIVECVGGGGGGGNAIATAGNTSQNGSAGGSGAYAKKLCTSGDIGASQNYVVGAGGVGGSNGTTTSFGALLSCGGGSAGPTLVSTSTTANLTAGGAGGTAVLGDFIIPGQAGSGCFRSTSGFSLGTGGSTIYGSGAVTSSFARLDSVYPNIAGVNGNGYGSGGSGAWSVLGNVSGGTGGGGIIIITEYIS